MTHIEKKQRPGGDRGVESKSAKVSTKALYSAKIALTLVPQAATVTGITVVALSPVAKLAVELSTGTSVTVHPSELLDQRSFRRLARAHGVLLPRVPHGAWNAKVRRVASQRGW